MRTRALALAVLLVLAGCGGSAPGSTDATTTLTPAPPLSADPPPGLSATGVPNATALANAHGGALEGRSFTLRSRFRIVDDAGPIYRENTTQRVAADGRVARTRHVEWSDRAPVRSVVTRLDVYHANGTTYARAVDGGVSYDRTAEPDGLDDVRGVSRLRDLYVAGRHWAVTETRVDGGRGYTLVSTDVALTALRTSSFVQSPRDVRLRVTLTAAGRLVGWRLTYVVDFADGPAQATRTARVSAVGGTEVVEPAWLDTARNATA